MDDVEVFRRTAAIAKAIMDRFGREDAAREGFKRAMQNSCTEQQFSDLLAFVEAERQHDAAAAEAILRKYGMG